MPVEHQRTFALDAWTWRSPQARWAGSVQTSSVSLFVGACPECSRGTRGNRGSSSTQALTEPGEYLSPWRLYHEPNRVQGIVNFVTGPATECRPLRFSR